MDERKKESGISVPTRNEEARVHSRKDIPVLIRDDDRPIFFDRDDAGFLDQGSIAARNEHRGAGDGKTTSASFALIHATDSSLE